jgi:hypothetical protein
MVLDFIVGSRIDIVIDIIAIILLLLLTLPVKETLKTQLKKIKIKGGK